MCNLNFFDSSALIKTQLLVVFWYYIRRETALICAARTGQLDCVRHLLNYGAETETRDGEGHTALWCAVREQREEVVTYLIHRRVQEENAQIVIL